MNGRIKINMIDYYYHNESNKVAQSQILQIHLNLNADNGIL